MNFKHLLICILLFYLNLKIKSPKGKVECRLKDPLTLHERIKSILFSSNTSAYNTAVYYVLIFFLFVHGGINLKQ